MMSAVYNKKRILRKLYGVLLLITLLATAAHAQTNDPAIIPKPSSVQIKPGFFLLDSSVGISCSNPLQPAAQLLQEYIRQADHLSPAIGSSSSNKRKIQLTIDSGSGQTKKEGYELTISNNFINITAHDYGGMIHGIETLRQLLLLSKDATLQNCVIKDAPRFSYRGMALDVSRHMFPVSFIKKYIDLLALYKFNTFHWHLTDDQGWRIEIKKYPLLQTTAAYRNETLIGHKKDVPHRFDGTRYGGYYTQDEVKEVVRYAAQRGITIIPEIEMPGHALAALSAYPDLGCTGGAYEAATFWGIFTDVYCAGNDSTFQFLEDVLDEVMDLFPSKYIHIGGDECLKIRWKQCPKCQKRIRDEHLQNEEELQSYFIGRIEKYVNGKGRNIIGWDEILEGGLAPNATVMSWRGTEGGVAAAKQKHNVIMTPESYLYFDYYQSLSALEPLASGGYLPLKKVYDYKPVDAALPDSFSHYITGVEGQAWSEYFEDTAKAEYMIFPRAIALAEIGWTADSLSSYNKFSERLRKQQRLLHTLQVNSFPYYDEIYSSVTATKAGVAVSLQSDLPGAVIRYTTDGTEPSAKSPVYKTAIQINHSCLLKAKLFAGNQPVNRTYRQAFHISKSTGARVRLQTEPVTRFNPSAQVLTNSVFATNLYNNNQWLGFAGNDCDAVIDLGKTTSFSEVTLHVLNYHWQKMWAPEWLAISVSEDGKTFHQVFLKKDISGNGIITITAALPTQSCRYVKIMAKNKSTIPPGEYGEGGKALLLIDEVQIN